MSSEDQKTGPISLLIVSHGSSFEPESYAPVLSFARDLAARERFAEVGVGFYKQDPTLRDGWENLDGDHIVVVPFLASAGFFCTRILPKKLGFGEIPFDTVTEFEGRDMVYTEPVGTDPRMWQLVDDAAQKIITDEDLDGAHTTLIVAGHGTPRHKASGKTVHDCVNALSERSNLAYITAAFVDEDPFVDDVLDHCPAGDVIVVPYFVANGPHVEGDIPSGLGIEGDVWANPHTVGALRIWMCEAIGIDPDVVEIIAELARAGSGKITPA